MSSMQQTYHVGIDLGTSNSSLAYRFSEEKLDAVHLLAIKQLDSSNTQIASPLLPSFLFAPLEAQNLAEDWIPGIFAKKQAFQTQGRVVSSAKSWLAHPFLKAKDPILPWASSCEKKISPIDASSLYLKTLWQSFESFLEQKEQQHSPCLVTITVPASFDERAREETLQAAKQAGIEKPNLLEEPQAAFYAWIASHQEDWRQLLKPKDVILVCDIGGGTTDFSLIVADEKNGDLALERVSIGPHLLLGGDNMDLAIAYYLKDKIEQAGKTLDTWQFQNLIASSREAKEELLTKGPSSSSMVSLSSKGSNLFASHIKEALSYDELEALLVEGFFPKEAFFLEKAKMQLAAYQSSASAPLSELGLDYEHEPSITSHLFAFLCNAREALESNLSLKLLTQEAIKKSKTGVLAPNKILFNGGVFHSQILRKRVLDLLSSCFAEEGSYPTELESIDLDLAVSKGAAYYSSLQSSLGALRIRSATARSYYLEIASSKPAIPGRRRSTSALCIVSQGTEEGSVISVSQRLFSLMLDQTAQFRFFSSIARPSDQPGLILEDPQDQLEESMVLSAFLDREGLATDAAFVCVLIEVEISLSGVLSVSMKHPESGKTWQLSWNLRP